MTKVTSLIGQRWRELEEEEKSSYKEKAEKDKRRYEKEVEEYNERVLQVA